MGVCVECGEGKGAEVRPSKKHRRDTVERLFYLNRSLSLFLSLVFFCDTKTLLSK
jgi:hypothetical protein